MTKSTPAPDAVRLAFHCESARLVPLLRQEAHRLGKGIPSDRPGIHKDLWTAALIIEQAEEAFAFNQKAAFALAAAPAPATARGGWAFNGPYLEAGLAALASQPQATGGAVERDDATVAVMQLAQWARQAFTHSTDTDEMAAKKIGAKVSTILAAIATQPAPSPGEEGP